jgi:hypothetical protein
VTGLPGSCEFPSCALPAATANRVGQPTCKGHRLVVVGSSYVNDHHADGGHG